MNNAETLTEARAVAERTLKDLGMQNLPPEEQERALTLISERFNQVLMERVFTLATPEQRSLLQTAMDQGQEGALKLTELVSQIDGLAEEVEKAWDLEYEALVKLMK